MTKNKYCFYSPSRNVGGQQLLFCRLAKFLIINDYDVCFIDYEDGFCHIFLKEYSYNRVIFEDKVVELDTAYNVIIPLSYFYIADRYLNLTLDSKIYYWSISPVNIFGYFKSSKISEWVGPKWSYRLIQLFYPLRLNRVKKKIRHLQEMKQIWFMDYANSHHSRYFLSKNIEVDYVPIPVEYDTNRSVLEARSEKDNIVNIAWLGRVAEDHKYYAILTIIDFIKNYKGEKKIVFHILGDGDALEKIRKYVSNLNFEVIVVGRIINEELTTYLKEKVDVLFSMGTSALEGGIRGVPSVIIDARNFRTFNRTNYKFRWLFETKLFTLGFLDSKLSYEAGIHNFSEIINFAINDNSGIGEKCRIYVKKNHSIDAVGKMVLKKT